MQKENSQISFFDLTVSHELGKQECYFFELIKTNQGITRQSLSIISGRPINAVSGRVAGLLKIGCVEENGNEYYNGRPRAKLFAV